MRIRYSNDVFNRIHSTSKKPSKCFLLCSRCSCTTDLWSTEQAGTPIASTTVQHYPRCVPVSCQLCTVWSLIRSIHLFLFSPLSVPKFPSIFSFFSSIFWNGTWEHYATFSPAVTVKNWILKISFDITLWWGTVIQANVSGQSQNLVEHYIWWKPRFRGLG